MIIAGPARLALLFLLACTSHDANVEPPRTVADLAGYSEGIAFDSAGTAYVSLLHRGAIMRIGADGAPATWMSIQDPNGHRVLPDGSHLVAARGGIYHLAADGRRLDSVTVHLAGLPELLPNDLALDGDAGFYVSAPAANGVDQARGSRLLYVDSARTVTEVGGAFIYPNGVLVRPDGRVLYVDDSGTNRIYAFEITGPGRLSKRTTFATLPDSSADTALDGMTIDAQGNLYVAHYGAGRIEVLDSTGRLLHRLPAGNRLPSNVAFGGRNLSDLFITGAPSDEQGAGMLARLPLRVRGRNPRTLPASSPRSGSSPPRT